MSKAMKWIYCGIAGCFILCILIFHSVFLTFLATWSLQAYSLSHWGKSLQYENIFLDGNQLVLVQPHFEDDSSFMAERAAFHFRFNLWKRQLQIEVEMDKPHWHFQASLASQWEKWVKILSQEGKWIKISPHFHIREGLVSWAFEDSMQSHCLNFDLELNNQAGGYITLYLDSPASASDFIVLQTLKTPQGMNIKCNFEKNHCSSLVEFARFLGFDFFPWQVASGFLQGELTAIFPEKQRPYLEGDFIAENLVLHQIEGPLKGEIGKARLNLKKNQMADEFNHQIPATIGNLEILEPASLVYQSPVQDWAIHQIRGSIQLNEMETALIDLQAGGGTAYHPSEWNLKGKANLNAQRALNLDAMLFCSSGEQSRGKIHLIVDQFLEKSKHAKIQCENLSYSECGFLQTLLATFWPVFNTVILQDGEFNALIEADIMHEGLGELYVKQFEAFHLRSKLKPWNMTCDFGQVRGYGKVQLGTEDFWQTANAALHLEDGQIEFDGLMPPLPMTDIQAHLLIQQGHVEHSLVTLQIAGLKGNMDIEWSDHKQLLTFKLDGIVQDLADLFPNILQEGLRKHFYHNRLIVLANLKKPNQQIELDGTFHIQRTDAVEMDVVHFGCEVKKIQDQSTSKYVPTGWFHAQKLPLEKFLSPFIFRNGNLQMSGEAEFKGSFDDQTLLIKYDANQLKIENENLCIDIPHAHSSVPGQLMGTHQVDLQTYAYEGSLPLQSATYYEKNSGLVFQDIHGLATFKNDFIRIFPIEANCQGVYFNGELELEYSDPAPGVFDLMIHCPTLSGKISQIQHLLAYLEKPSLLHNIPLEGDVSAKEKGLKLKFGFIPQDYHLQADFQGMVTEGALSFEEADMALRGIDMDLSYRHQNQILEFSDIQGVLLVGKPRRVEEYLFSGNRLQLHPLGHNPNIEVDIAIKDKGYELLRLAGHTQDEREGVKTLFLDKTLSHFSCIYPHVWQCRLKDWSNIEQFELRSQFDLQRFLQDLQRFRQTGFLFLSHSVIDKISQFLPLEGKGLLALNYHPDQRYTYQLEGLNIKQENSPEHYGLIKGSKQDKKWIIDQLQWDEWNVSAELHQLPEKWRIPFLGLKVGQALLLGLEGDWLHEQAYLQAKLKFCEVDLSQLENFEPLKPFAAKWWPKGILKATGELKWDLLTFKPLEGCKVSVLAEVSNLSLRDYEFNIPHPFQMRVQPHHYFCLENVQSEFILPHRQAFIDLKQFEYDFPDEMIHCLEAVFQIPHHQIKTIGEKLHHHFPEILEESVKELLIAAKQDSFLKGILAYNKGKDGQNLLRLELEDGLYTFKKREYDLKKLKLQLSENELQFSAFSHWERCPFQMIGQVKWPTCQEGKCQLIDSGSAKPLLIHWEKLSEQRIVLRSMQGEFNGCSFLLKEDGKAVQNRDWIALQGQITIDFNRFRTLLTLPMAEMIQKLNISSPYSFAGSFWLKPDGEKPFLDSVSFKGQLIGKEVVLKGYQMQSLQADMQYIPGRLDLQNFSMQDPAGGVKAANCLVTRNDKNDQWNFFVPRLTVKNLKPNLLRDIEESEQANSKFRSLILKRVEFHELQGEVNQIETWQAQGNLHFMNPSRKHSIHPIHALFAIPAEIILRLGLDPHVLNPVTGIIDFNLQGDRFYLTRFKDVYSEGRGSKFYLAQDEDPSWMDFDGNLSVNIRMKQYNLIFKIAELFTVSIKGNIKKPQYRLLKHSKASRKPHAMSMIKTNS